MSLINMVKLHFSAVCKCPRNVIGLGSWHWVKLSGSRRSLSSLRLLEPPLACPFPFCACVLPLPTVQGPFLGSIGLSSSSFSFGAFSLLIAYEEFSGIYGYLVLEYLPSMHRELGSVPALQGTTLE